MARQLRDWEQFFDGSSLKAQHMSRYLYEHLFLGHLVFDGQIALNVIHDRVWVFFIDPDVGTDAPNASHAATTINACGRRQSIQFL